jgi:aspartyl/asparaginyl-tRNA synthetase
MTSCADVLAGRALQNTPVTVKGWLRARRDSKAGISFVNVADGSSFHPVQVVAANTLPNYADEVLRLTAGQAVLFCILGGTSEWQKSRDAWQRSPSRMWPAGHV